MIVGGSFGKSGAAAMAGMAAAVCGALGKEDQFTHGALIDSIK